MFIAPLSFLHLFSIPCLHLYTLQHVLFFFSIQYNQITQASRVSSSDHRLKQSDGCNIYKKFMLLSFLVISSCTRNYITVYIYTFTPFFVLKQFSREQNIAITIVVHLQCLKVFLMYFLHFVLYIQLITSR